MFFRYCLIFVWLGMVIFSPSILPGIAAASSAPARLTFYTGFSGPDKEIIQAILKEAYQRIDIDIEVIQLPARRALLQANSEGDGDAARVSKIKEIAPDETSNLILVPESFHTMRMMVFTAGMEFPVQGWDSLMPYRNGGRIGSKFVEKFLPENQKKIMLPSSAQLFHMLANDRLDTVVDWENFGLFALKQLQMSRIKMLPKEVATSSFYHLIHKKNAHLVPKIAIIFKEMKTDGTSERIKSEVLAKLLSP